jgi:hypothetical protein
MRNRYLTARIYSGSEYASDRLLWRRGNGANSRTLTWNTSRLQLIGGKIVCLSIETTTTTPTVNERRYPLHQLPVNLSTPDQDKEKEEGNKIERAKCAIPIVSD